MFHLHGCNIEWALLTFKGPVCKIWRPLMVRKNIANNVNSSFLTWSLDGKKPETATCNMATSLPEGPLVCVHNLTISRPTVWKHKGIYFPVTSHLKTHLYFLFNLMSIAHFMLQIGPLKTTFLMTDSMFQHYCVHQESS